MKIIKNKLSMYFKIYIADIFLILLIICFSIKPLIAQENEEKFEATVQSLEKHEIPEWYEDAKLGIFITWGLYSVPGWAPTTGELGSMSMKQFFQSNPYAEWYWNSMRIEGSPTQQYHKENYGRDFDFFDFSSTFNKEIKKWNPENWASLFKDVNARYVVLLTKHHDGFILWPSNILNPYLPYDQQQASRDIAGELTKAVRDQGLRMGLYYSGGIDWSFKPVVIDGTKGTEESLNLAIPNTDQYANYADAHWRELIDRYEPAILWNDIGYPQKGNALEIFAEYYNKNSDVIINNRWSRDVYDITTPEYAQYDEITNQKWESIRGIAFSFGYNRKSTSEHMLSVNELVDMFVDIVSKNGNLLLNVGPKADGTIPEPQVERLRGLGNWLDSNGEAVFGTRPWVKAQAETAENHRVRFTRKNDTVYAILLDKPSRNQVVIKSIVLDEGADIELLGRSGNLNWEQEGNNLKIDLPKNVKEAPAHSFKITPEPYGLLKDK